MARPRALFLTPLLLLLAGCGGADLVSTPSGASVTVSPQAVLDLPPGKSVTYTAVVPGTKNQGVTWTVVGGDANGTFTGATGVYTAPLTSGTYTVVATSTENTGKAGSATAEVKAAAAVTINPGTAELWPSQSKLFTASVSGGGSQAVTWSVLGGDTHGTLTGTSGLYTAPDLPGTYTVLATSVANPTLIGKALVTVKGAVTVSLSPSQVKLLPGATQAFTATVIGITPETVDWSVVGANSGTIDTNGTYTAPMTGGIYTVKATSRANGISAGTATVTVSPVNIDIVPLPDDPPVPGQDLLRLDQGASRLFQAVLTGTTNASVKWSVNGGTTTTQTGPYLFTAPSTSGLYVIKGIPDADPTVFDTVTVTVNRVAISDLSPVRLVVPPKQLVHFTAKVTGSTNQAILWSISEGGGGSINSYGVYTAPDTVGSFTIVAKAAADLTAPPKVALVTTGLVTISQSDNSPQPAGGTVIFSAVVAGVTDPKVVWEIFPIPSDGGIERTTGFFTAPSTPGLYRIRATDMSFVNPPGFPNPFAEVTVKVI